MTPEKQRGGGRAFCAAILACVMILAAGAAQAQSAYACRALENHPALPAVEGENGTFFAIRPELQAHHGLADETIAFVAELSAALAERGTTLVYLPVPTRAQVMTHLLPSMAAHIGYDAGHSTAVHEDMIKRLRDAGITVADPRAALRKAALAGQRPFFPTDPRPTSAGTSILAQTVGETLAAHPALSSVTRATFTSTEGEAVTLPSGMRRALQTACQSELPAVTTPSFTTQMISGAAPSASLIVVGTDTTYTQALNLTGFLSEATGLQAAGYGVPTGGAFAAISTYLTSADFQTAPPRVLVWEVPVSASLGIFGTQPIRELIAAATNSCTVPIQLRRAATGNAMVADLSGVTLSPKTVLSFDTGGAAAPSVQFDFVGADDLTRTRSIYRHARQALTGMFYMPVSGLAAHDLQTLTITTETALGAEPRLRACF